jgi:hypothetical protein
MLTAAAAAVNIQLFSPVRKPLLRGGECNCFLHHSPRPLEASWQESQPTFNPTNSAHAARRVFAHSLRISEKIFGVIQFSLKAPVKIITAER